MTMESKKRSEMLSAFGDAVGRFSVAVVDFRSAMPAGGERARLAYQKYWAAMDALVAMYEDAIGYER